MTTLRPLKNISLNFELRTQEWVTTINNELNMFSMDMVKIRVEHNLLNYTKL